MTETALAASPLATPLAALLASAEPHPEAAAYRGVLTPIELDARASEIAALVSGAAVHDLGWLHRVEVRGEDRFRWLSGIVTNMVNDLPANSGAWNLVLNAQGRIQGDLTVWREHDALELEIAADQYDRLLAHLDHFIIMDDVELVARDAAGETAVGLTGPKADEVLRRMGLPTLADPLTSTRAEWNGMDLLIRRGYGVLAEHYELWVPVTAVAKLWRFLTTGGAIPVGSAALEAFRIAEGIPAYGVDMVERDLPQETSQMRALSFSKGCYLGQEIVERIRSRGTVHKHLRLLEMDGPLPGVGVDLMQEGSPEGQADGHIRSVAELPLAGGTRRFALAMMRGEAELRDQPFAYSAAETKGAARLLAAPAKF
jgi:folate-binding protein YgfZ